MSTCSLDGAGVTSEDEVRDLATSGESAAERTRLILETANDAFVAIDDDGVITDWNPAAEATFGYSPGEAVGLPLVETIIPPRLRADHLRGLDRFLETGEQRVLFERVELPALHRDGHEFAVEATIWPTRDGDDGGWRFNAFLRDISNRKRLEREAQLLHEIAVTANAATEAEPAVRHASRQILAFTGWELTHTYLPTGQQELRPSGWWESADGDYRNFREATATTTFEFGAGLPGTVAASGASHWVVDLESDPNFPRQPAAVACGLRSAYAFPVLVEERVVAVMEFFSSAERAPAPDLLEVMGNVGLLLGRVFERQEALERRNRMIAMIAHELRTPLAMMTGFAGLLEDAWGELAEGDRLEHVRGINRQGDRLQRFVSDLLTLSRMQSRGVVARAATVVVADAVSRALSELDVEGVRTVIEDGLTAHVDRDHLCQMVANLVSNAEKYGAPPIIVRAASIDGGVELAVSDRGSGVPSAFVPDLFVDFTRASEVTGEPGTGLGLAIVRMLAEANDGSVSYQPNAPEGACFVLSLPASPPPES